MHGLDRHNSQGAIGKALDTINIAAGLASKEAVVAKPTADLEYMDYQAFRSLLYSSDLSKCSKHEILKTIGASFKAQITPRAGGYSVPENPVIAEGAGGWTTSGGTRLLRFERIACDSLAHLFDGRRFTAQRHAAPRAFLKQFAQRDA